jgi:uncharacterized protein YbaR (Trm112 family)/SAM-dependent methyltransferase
MHDRLLEIIACPACRQQVSPTQIHRDHGRIVTGWLECHTCQTSYPIRAGVPRLLPRKRCVDSSKSRRVADHFALEFTAEALEDRDISPPDILEFLFFTRTGIDPLVYKDIPAGFYPTELPADHYQPDDSFLTGKRVLDGGCGPARFLPVAARRAEHVVGLDLGDHVERAAQRCHDLPNVDIVQGSVLHPPFVRDAFDFVYTIGVLHHTEDPRGGALALAESVRSEGAMAIWVYPNDYWGNRFRRPVGKWIHSRLAGRDPEVAHWITRHCLYPLGRVQGTLARRRWTKWIAAPLYVVSVPRHPVREVMISTIYDYFAPPVIHTHSYDEVRTWLADAGFRRFDRLPVATSWLATEKADRGKS